ncbi:hypothetical protein BDZ94DRAFT_1308655 [Collybia nuda]|uniref:Uncharacterized protein n=1 Tax=Collybia nuda TaxID=64659 RepID=A0A9P5Y785_9AGAR|nr:hypothetical protein BDZ94DRAFT_1308655 [Collybia nuda]
MSQAGLSSNLVNDTSNVLNNSAPIASSSNANGSSSSKTADSSSTVLNSKNKSSDIPSIPTRLSEHIANSQQNRPNIYMTKQNSNLPTLPEEDIAIIVDFTANPTPSVNPRKHARVSQGAANEGTADKSPTKKRGCKGKGKAAEVPLDVDSMDALLGTATQSTSRAVPTDTHHSPPAVPSRTPPPIPCNDLASPSPSDKLFTYTQSELEALIAEHADRLVNNLQSSHEVPAALHSVTIPALRYTHLPVTLLLSLPWPLHDLTP